VPEAEAGAEPTPEEEPEPALAAAVGETAALASELSVGDERDMPDDDASHLSGYREALQSARAQPGTRSHLLSSPDFRIKVGLGAALVLILLSAGILYATRTQHTSTPTSAQFGPGHGAAPTTAGQPTPSVAPTPAASPAASGPGPLTELVSAGSGGTGWTVARIRIGSPGSGITRVVLDLNGTGSTPTTQMGRAGDGSIYLSVPGLTISPSVVSGVAPSGTITAISQVDGAGTSLRFSTSGRPGFSIGYLSAPNRLVLDFK
jgi:hypothetical protein